LILFPTNAGRYTINDGGLAVLDTGPTITPSQPPLYLYADMHGFNIQQTINAISSVAANAVGWIDVSLLD
jgi:hypothetical protein